MIGDVFTDEVDRWMVPDDRQLALRGRLGTGWSTICIDHFKRQISEVERDFVITVLRRNEYIQIQEQYRIGRMVTKLKHMKKNIYGDGDADCLICGSTPGLFKDALHFCGCCGMLVCSKCSIELTPTYDGYGKYNVCALCNEDRMVWKRSGAWFYKAIPTYIITSDGNGRGSITVPENQPYCTTPNWIISHPIGRLGESQDSILGGSDESDVIEHTSAFEVTEDKMALDHSDIITNEDSRSLNSFSASFKKQNSIKETILNDENKSNSQNDLHKMLSARLSSTSTNSGSKVNDDIVENDSQTSRGSLPSLSSSTDSVDETKGSVFRKISKHLPLVAVNSSNSLKHQDEVEVGLVRSRSGSTINSEQDVDALFTSYEEEKSKETEYTGPQGMIKFTLQYDPNTQDLLIIIDSCNGLKIGEGEVIPSAYVKSIILPVSPDSAKASKKRTPTIKKTADPVYNFCIDYPGVSSDDIACKGVQLSVIDETKNTIGETCVPLKGLISHPIQQFRRILDSRAQTDSLFLDFKKVEEKAGRIELALHYLSKQEKLIVGIIRCVGLKALDPNGYSDPYVKCYLLPDPEKRSKQKTSVKKKTLNPEFNEELHFEISHSDLAQKTLYLAVWDHDVGRSNDFIGGLSLGIESTGEVLKHWFETLQTADKRFIRWHDLDDNCLFFNE